MRASLVKIQGGVDLINERLLHANAINDERHVAVRADIKDIRETQHRHSNRIGVLEAKNTLAEGERKGFSIGGRLAWSLASLAVGSGGVFAIMEAFK